MRDRGIVCLHWNEKQMLTQFHLDEAPTIIHIRIAVSMELIKEKKNTNSVIFKRLSFRISTRWITETVGCIEILQQTFDETKRKVAYIFENG